LLALTLTVLYTLEEKLTGNPPLFEGGGQPVLIFNRLPKGSVEADSISGRSNSDLSPAASSSIFFWGVRSPGLIKYWGLLRKRGAPVERRVFFLTRSLFIWDFKIEGFYVPKAKGFPDNPPGFLKKRGKR
jgi:hypothetical protein